MLTHRGFSAWIVVNGKEVSEHLVAVDSDANRVSCWIPGKERQRFSVCWRDHGGKVDTCAFITLDGFVVPGRFLFGEGVACREGVRASRTTERPFTFQRVHDDVPSMMQATAKDAGMITLRIKRITRVASKPANALLPLPSTVLGKRKAGDLFIGFGEEAPAFEQYSSTWSVRPYEQDDPSCKEPKTYVSFVFRYRTREFLEAQGIVLESAARPPQRTLARRVASMPSSMPSSMAPTPPDSPETGPANNKKKMASVAEHLRDGPRQPQGNPIETRRTVSWKIVTNNPSAPIPLPSPMSLQRSYFSPGSDSVGICEEKAGYERP